MCFEQSWTIWWFDQWCSIYDHSSSLFCVHSFFKEQLTTFDQVLKISWWVHKVYFLNQNLIIWLNFQELYAIIDSLMSNFKILLKFEILVFEMSKNIKKFNFLINKLISWPNFQNFLKRWRNQLKIRKTNNLITIPTLQ